MQKLKKSEKEYKERYIGENEGCLKGQKRYDLKYKPKGKIEMNTDGI